MAGAPPVSPFGVAMVGPVIYTFGSPEQKERWLPGITSGETLWCQGYSEPNAGSDLASLKTRAERKQDHYLVNGQKIWTTQAHWADMMFCLVRTDPDAKKHHGISYVLFSMDTPGIEVRPIKLIEGDKIIEKGLVQPWPGTLLLLMREDDRIVKEVCDHYANAKYHDKPTAEADDSAGDLLVGKLLPGEEVLAQVDMKLNVWREAVVKTSHNYAEMAAHMLLSLSCALALSFVLAAALVLQPCKSCDLPLC